MTRTVLITGASSGIGLAAVETLAKAGYRVIGTTRSEVSDTEIAAIGVTMCRLDVCDDTSVSALKTQLTRAGAMPDAIVLNAGFGLSGPVEETPTASAIAQFDTNVIGVHRVVREFLPALRGRHHGRVIIIGSMLGRLPLPFQTFYAASKAAVAAYCDGLRMEAQQFGVKVSLIEPGDHQSEFASNRARSAASTRSPYEPGCEKALAIMEENERTGPPAQRVADLVQTVLERSHPKARYLCIQHSERRILWLKRFLNPERFERFVKKELGFTNY